MPIARVAPTSKLNRLFAEACKNLKLRFEAELDVDQQRFRHLVAISAPIRRLIQADEEARSALKALGKLNQDTQKVAREHGAGTMGQVGVHPLFHQPIHPGLSFVSPPYDYGDPPDADKNAGTFRVKGVNKGGWIQRGVAVILTSTQDVTATIYPNMSYSWNWEARPLSGVAFTRGGVAVSVVGPDGNTVADNSFWGNIWQENSVVPSAGKSGSGSWNMQLDPFGILKFEMKAKANYFVFGYCWTYMYADDGVATANIDCTLPVIPVEAT